MKYPWIIYLAILMHLWWGFMLLLDERAGFVTAISSTLEIIPYPFLAYIFIAVALLAVYGVVRRDMLGLLFTLPQQMMLVLSAYGAIEAAWTSQFADGVIRPQAFISADQMYHAFVAVLHTAAILDWHWGRR